MADDPPLQPLVVPPGAIPTAPPTSAAAQARSNPFYLGGLPQGESGNYIKDWFTEFHKSHGITPDLPNLSGIEARRVLPPLGPYRGGEPTTPGPVGVGGPTEIRLEHLLNPDKFAQITGWKDSPAGTVARSLGTAWSSAMELDKAATTVDPDYDVFRDRQIQDAGFGNQIELFLGSTSRRATAERIEQIRARQREAEWIERGSGTLQMVNMAGGLFGDPLNWLPVTMGAKGLQLARKAAAGTLTGAELKMLSQQPALYGALADGARGAAYTAAFGVAEQTLLHQMDPTLPAEVGLEMLIPTALAGSLSILTGATARWSGRSLAHEVRGRGFLAPVPPRPFSGIEAQARTMDEVFQARAGTLPVAQAYSQASADFQKSLLNTVSGPVEREDFRTFMKDNKAVDARGRPMRAYHGTSQAFREFDFSQAGARTAEDYSGGGQWFSLDPRTASAFADEAGGNIHPVYLRFTNPKDITSEVVPNTTGDMAGMERTLESIRDAIGRAKAQGHDAVTMVSDEGAGAATQVVVFDKSQIRSFSERYKVDPIPPSNNGAFPKSSLATDYGPIRISELKGSTSLGGGFHEPPTLRHTADFGDFMKENKLVDAAGQPIMVYHGTTSVFDTFSNWKLGKTTGAKSAKLGHFFAGTPETANAYSGKVYVEGVTTGSPNIRPTYLRMTNPYVVRDTNRMPANMARDGTMVTDINGTVWRAHEDKWQEILDPPQPSTRRGFLDVDKETGQRLVDRTFEPGELPRWEPEIGRTTDEIETTGAYRNIFYTEQIKKAKRAGHDGVILEHTDDGGGKDTIYVVFNPKKQIRGFDQRWDTTPNAQGLIEGIHQPGSVGAMLTPQSLAYQQSVLLAQGRLMPTGIGIEKIPFNTVQRAFQGASLAAMRLQADLVSTGGVQTVGNAQGIANMPPVEAMIAMIWNRPMVQVLRETNDAWTDYRKAVASGQEVPPHAQGVDGRSDAARIADRIGTAAKDLISQGEKPLSYGQFNARVGLALRRGDVDAMDDAAAPYVQRAAAKHRAHYEHTKKEALDAGIFEEAYQDAVYQAMSDLRALKKEAKDTKIRAHKEKWSATQLREAEEVLLARTEDAQFKFRQTEDALKSLRDNGPTLNGTAPSYRPRIYNVQALLDGEQEFIDITVGWLQSRAMRAQHPLETEDAARIAKQIHEIVAKQNPVFERGDLQALFHGVAAPGSAMARSFTIPDELIGKFLVDDAETLLRYHTKQMGTAIEMKKRFGSLDLADEIAEIERDYRTAIEQANAGSPVATEQAKKLAAQMKTAIADAQATRDKLYGTYGASPDPHRWQSRTIRMAKQFTNLTLLGMSGITALGDLVRPVMTEGLEAVYGYGFKSLISESRATILRMNRHELELEGNGMELFNNVRALSAADTGDVFGSRGKFEHGMNAANQWMFVANGLNMVNQIDKEWARLSIGGRVNHVLLDLLADIPFSKIDRGRFAAVGIDEAIGRRIALQIQIHGQDFGSGGNALTMPNTTAWTDDYARTVYRSAMNQMVNRTVPTPGIGDRPNFFSTEIGGLMMQYRSFGVGALVRGAYSGLQEGGNQFWYGAAAAVGFAVLLNEVRSQLFYGKSSFDKPLPAILADGIDRSSILGIFGDANRAVETLSGQRIGLRPLIGASNPVDPSFKNIVGTVAGPSAQQATRVASVASDLLRGHPTAETYRDWRAVTPGGTLAVADPLFDAIFPTDYPKRVPKPGRPQQPAG